MDFTTILNQRGTVRPTTSQSVRDSINDSQFQLQHLSQADRLRCSRPNSANSDPGAMMHMPNMPPDSQEYLEFFDKPLEAAEPAHGMQMLPPHFAPPLPPMSQIRKPYPPTRSTDPAAAPNYTFVDAPANAYGGNGGGGAAPQLSPLPSSDPPPMTISSAPKIHHCSTCQKGFARRSDLSRHGMCFHICPCPFSSLKTSMACSHNSS